MYKAYFYSTSEERFFNFKPKFKDLVKAFKLHKDDIKEMQMDISSFEITKLKVFTK